MEGEGRAGLVELVELKAPEEGVLLDGEVGPVLSHVPAAQPLRRLDPEQALHQVPHLQGHEVCIR